MENIKNWWSELHYTSLQKRSLAIVAALIVAISAFFIMRSPAPTEALMPPPIDIESPITQIVVDVQGAVVHPGVYHLAGNSRVYDAIRAAGGLTKKADPSDVNQARLLTDGEQIYIYALFSPSASASTSSGVKAKPKGSAFVLINRASAK